MQEPGVYPELMGVSSEAARMREFAGRAAALEHTLLLRGETGAGKDHLAELIHALGTPKRPFVHVDCGALPEDLSESELFGHARGAFTGADRPKLGLVRQAEGGTLFLNEIENMTPALQTKFLRLLDKKNFRAVGGTQEFPIGARVIAATNADLDEMVRRREFREDLFYRLDVVRFTIAPLRERKEDIAYLAKYFLRVEAPLKMFSGLALALLASYPWPGNVRELKSAVLRAVFSSGNEVKIGPEHIVFSSTGIDAVDITTDARNETEKFRSWREMEERYLRALYERTGGNISKTARVSGLTREAVRRKARKYGLER